MRNFSIASCFLELIGDSSIVLIHCFTDGRKSTGEQVSINLDISTATTAAAKGGEDRDRDGGRDGSRRRRGSHSCESRSCPRGGERRWGDEDQQEKRIRTAKTALTTEAAEAFRSRKDLRGLAGP